MDLRKRRLQWNNAWQPDKPCVIATLEGQQRCVVAVNAAAAACGITPGMALSRARVIQPDVKVEPAQPHTDAHALQRLAVGALRYSPLVAACPPDGLWIDATGAAHLFGGEAAMVEKITRRLHTAGIRARAAIAGTPGAAWAWSRYGHGNPVLSAGAENRALDGLPLYALRLPQMAAASLRRVGVKTIGDLRRVPRATIPIRFGADVLRRLDQALGLAPEAITPILPPAARRRCMNFAEPISTPEDLKRAIDILTRQLCRDLEEREEGARRLDLVFGRVDGRPEAIRITTARPTRDVLHMAKLLGEKLPTVDPGFGIEVATLTAWRVGALRPIQLENTHLPSEGRGCASAQRDLGELVDRISTRVGARRVFKMAHIASDIPERAAVPGDPMEIEGGAIENGATAEGASPSSWPPHLPRPVRLLSPPEPVHVIALLPDYPPAKFRWRDEMHTVCIADGPERIFGEWWRAPLEVGEVRDYFRVENERGERYWLFRASRRTGTSAYRWYMHGAFA